MESQLGFLGIIRDQTARSLGSLNHVLNSIPDAYWEKEYCAMPLWKHVYHTLHSLDQWYINPCLYTEPPFHSPWLNDLDKKTPGYLSKAQLRDYALRTQEKILAYLGGLPEEQLLQTPPQCPYSRFQLILAQHRHLDMHIGMLMGFLIAGEGIWPDVLGLESELPQTPCAP